MVFSTAEGLGYKDTSAFAGLSQLSMAGGAPILLSGLNFAGSSGANGWKFAPRWLDGVEVWGPPMDSDDEMNSNALSGRLAIVAPSAAELMNVDESLFDGEFLPSGWYFEPDGNTLKFDLRIRNTEDSWDVECSSANRCLFGYSRDYTPILMDITPPNVC